MAQYINKDALLKEIERRIKAIPRGETDKRLKAVYGNEAFVLNDLLSFIDTLEVKEVQEYVQPDYSCFEITYKCGKKPHWCIGDTLAYYESCSDREGECVLGKITKVEFDEEQCDWLYTFEDGSVYDEQSLLEDETYKKK